MSGFLPAFLGTLGFAFLAVCLICLGHALHSIRGPAIRSRRHRPDYERIAELELALGMREPTEAEKLIAEYDDPELTWQRGKRYGNRVVLPGPAPRPRPRPAEPKPPITAAAAQQLLASHLTTLNEARRGTKKWDAAYERGQDEARDWLSHLGHDHEPSIDVTPVGSPTPQFIRGRCIT